MTMVGVGMTIIGLRGNVEGTFAAVNEEQTRYWAVA